MTTLPLADVRARLSKIVDDAERTHERYDITRNGHRAAVLLGADDFDALQETIAALSVQKLLTSHIQGAAELEHGDTVDAEQLSAIMHAAGRAAKG